MYAFIKFILRVFGKIVFFTKTVGSKHIPEQGAVILAANHTSMWDPVVLLPNVRRNMRTMGKKELFSNKLLAPFLKMAGAFPVNRQGADVTAIKTALKALKNGEIFTIFPSGTRVKGADAADAKAGVALIASRANVPVIPVAISGGFRPFHRVTITFGEPMTISPADGKKATSEELKAFADAVMEEIKRLGA